MLKGCITKNGFDNDPHNIGKCILCSQFITRSCGIMPFEKSETEQIHTPIMLEICTAKYNMNIKFIRYT